MLSKVLIFGVAGMAGHIMAERFRKSGKYEVVCSARRSAPGVHGLDVTDHRAVVEFVRNERPAIVINCVGMLVGACSERPDLAILCNSYFPNLLSRLGTELGFRLIHISTDCVFSGHRGAYRENDFRDGDTPYARSKALGEIINDRDLTIRTSIIGPELNVDGTGLFHWFMQQHGTVKGYSKAFWSGVTTIELARAVEAVLEQNISGLYQLTMPEKINKYDLLLLMRKLWNKSDVVVESYEGYCCDKSMVCTREDFDYQLPGSYEIMLNDMKTWIEEHKSWYSY